MVADRLFIVNGWRQGESRMISLTASGHAWRNCLCQSLEAGHDYDDDSVGKLFTEAAAWATEQNIPFNAEADHLAEFIESRDRKEPAIPEHVRRYCAHLKQLNIGEAPAPKAKPKVVNSPRSNTKSTEERFKEPYHRRAGVRR